MKRRRALSSVLWLGLTLLPGLAIVSGPLLVAGEPPIVGIWEGTLDPGAQPKKRIVVHVSSEEDGSLRGTIDYPDQSTSGIVITAINYQAPALHFEINTMQATYDGAMNKDNSQITGTWKQGGATLSLILNRTR